MKTFQETKMKRESIYSSLNTKNILKILNGDIDFGEFNGKKISMPYLSGPALCNLLTLFGHPTVYPQGALSRLDYLKSLLEYCIDRSNVPELLSHLFAKDKFSNALSGLDPEKIDKTHRHIIKIVIDEINKQLYFHGHELSIINKRYVVRPLNVILKVDAPKIKIIDRTFIKELTEKAKDDLKRSDFDSVITKGRTLIEEVFFYVIESKGEKPSKSGNVSLLYQQVKSLYNMHGAKDMDVRIKTLLSGLEKILATIAEMRNNNSDSHGVGSKRLRIEEHHATLFLNSSIVFAEFILAVAEKNKSKKAETTP